MRRKNSNASVGSKLPMVDRENRQHYVPACDAVMEHDGLQVIGDTGRISKLEKSFEKTQTISAVASQRYRPGHKQRAFRALQ